MSFLSTLFGGSSSPSSDQVAPWTNVPMTTAQADAEAWRLRGTNDENRRVIQCAPSGSMRPYFDAGDLVGYHNEPPIEELQVGAIMLLFEDGRPGLIMHRVTAIDVPNRSIMVQGDNNSYSDGWQPYSHVMGIVACVWYTNTPSPVLTS